MKILIIGSSKSKESQSLKQEGEKRNHQVKIISISNLIFSGREKLSIHTKEGLNIADFEAILFRAISRHIIEAKIIARYMKDKQRVVIDEILAGDNYEYHKLFMHSRLWAKNIPQPLTFQIFNLKEAKKAIKKVRAPLIVKHIKEMHGRSNFRFDSEKQAFEFFRQNKKRLGNYLIQEWYPSKYYYRTLVLGAKALGAMERLSFHCQNRPSIPLSQRSKKAELSSALGKISLRTTQALNIELAGLDIMPDKKGQLRILEINRSPQFKRFSQVTGINVAEKIIKYIEQKIS
jgi:ribosomal protein S6--L-glutamate ligase